MKNENGLSILREARAVAVSIRHTALLYFDLAYNKQTPQAGILPLLWLDAEHRPEVADLWRVHATEGCGDVRTRWVYDLFAPTPTFFFVCQFQTPVCTTFSVAFPLALYDAFLETMTACRQIVIIAESPPLGFAERTPSSPIECTLPEMAELLAHGLALESSHPDLMHMLAQWKYRQSFSSN